MAAAQEAGVAAAIYKFNRLRTKQSNYMHLMRNEMIAPFVSLDLFLFVVSTHTHTQ